MVFAAMLIHTLHPALEHRVETLDGVGMHVASHILAKAVLGEVVRSEVLAEGAILASLIGHNMGLRSDVRFDDRQKVSRLHAIHVEGPGRAAALNQGQHGVLVGGPTALLHAFLATDVGLVNLHHSALATHGLHGEAGHGLTYAVREEPGRLQADAQGAVKLIGADAFLRGTHQINRLKPLVHLDMAGLEHGTHADGERLAASVALVEADPGGLAAHLADPLRALAVVAHGTAGPQPGLNEREGGGFVVELRVVEDGSGHDGLL